MPKYYVRVEDLHVNKEMVDAPGSGIREVYVADPMMPLSATVLRGNDPVQDEVIWPLLT